MASAAQIQSVREGSGGNKYLVALCYCSLVGSPLSDK